MSYSSHVFYLISCLEVKENENILDWKERENFQGDLETQVQYRYFLCKLQARTCNSKKSTLFVKLKLVDRKIVALQ